MSKHDKRTVTIIVLLIIASIIVPLLVLPNAEFGGSDNAGSEMVNEITGGDYEPWASPLLEKIIGGELPGEVESLFFCIQSSIGVAIIAFFFGRFVQRKKDEAARKDD